jgi:hypothetical protein
MATYNSISKRKNSNSHYEENNDNNDALQPIQLCDRERSKLNKRIKLNRMCDVEINICNDCGYGYMNNKCRCYCNINTVNISGVDMKFCIFCEDSVSNCQCPISLWSIIQCNLCHICHDIFEQCNPNVQCILCEKFSNITDIGCRCIHGDIKFFLTDIDMKKMYDNSDYTSALETSEFQPICIHCGKHVSHCNCIEYNINEEIEKYFDEFIEQNEYENEYEQMCD